MISGFWRNVSRIIWKVYNKFFLSKQILEIFKIFFRIEEIIYKFIIMVMLICAGVLLNLIKEKKIIII